MDMNELRDAIWDHLFQAQGAKTFEEIAAITNRDPTVVRVVVNHEWFSVHDDRVSIAYSAPLSDSRS
jgi:hypothetical protein